MPTETDLTLLLTAWDQAHPAATAVTVVDMTVNMNVNMDMSAEADADWRHLLDEIAHPHTIQAFHRLAAAAV